jgi:predicted small metal-binding protein
VSSRHRHYCLECEWVAEGADGEVVEVVEEHQEQTGHTIESVKDDDVPEVAPVALVGQVLQLSEGAHLTPGDCCSCGTPGLLGGEFWDRAVWHAGMPNGCTRFARPLEQAAIFHHALLQTLNELYPPVDGRYSSRPSGVTAARVRARILDFVDQYVPERTV